MRAQAGFAEWFAARVPGGPASCPHLCGPASDGVLETPGGFVVCPHLEGGACSVSVERAERHRREDDRRVHRAMQNAGVPARLLLAGSDGGRATDAIRALDAAGPALDAGGAVVLAGPTGRGKSYAAAAACRRYLGCDRGRALWLTAHALGRAARADDFTTLLAAPFAVLDDLGVEHRTDSGWADAVLDEWIDVRQSNVRATIVTTNLDVASLRGRYADRIVSRLCDWATIVECGGPDLRRAAGAGA